MTKVYTDIEQSCKLAEILPIESADTHYEKVYFEGKQSNWFIRPGAPVKSNDIIPCWSLAALLNLLPNNMGRYTKSLYWFDDTWHCEYTDEDGEGIFGTSADNALDACYEMILKLHEQEIL